MSYLRCAARLMVSQPLMTLFCYPIHWLLLLRHESAPDAYVISQFKASSRGLPEIENSTSCIPLNLLAWSPKTEEGACSTIRPWRLNLETGIWIAAATTDEVSGESLNCAGCSYVRPKQQQQCSRERVEHG